MKELDLAWLAGFWDGEGSISMFSHKEKSGNWKIRPIVSVVNTDIGMINKVRKILENIGCSFHFIERKAKKRNHSTAYILQTSRMEYIIKFLNATLPYLSGEKKERAEITLSYCTKRLNTIERIPSKGSTPYDNEDWEAMEKFSQMGFKRSNNRSSTTTRETPTGDDIVCSHDESVS